MSWYSLFVVTGKEEYVEKWLGIFFNGSEITSLIPKRKLVERKANKTHYILKKMFPGYVLINTEINSEIYYILKKIPNMIRVLNSGDYYNEIPCEEIDCILRLLGNENVLDISNVYLVGTRIVVKSGPLKGMEGLIKAVDKRKQRVKIIIPFMGIPKEIDVGIKLLDAEKSIIFK